MSKKAQIIALKKAGYSNKRIADELGCHQAYVRTAWARRDGARTCDKARVLKKNAARAAAYHAMPKEQRAEIWRKAYQKARDHGATWQEARTQANGDLFKEIYRKHKDVYRQAYAQARMEAAE